MDVRIGVTYTQKELEIPLGEGAEPDDVRKQIESAIAAGDMLWLTDRRGRQYGIPAEKLAYVEVGSHDTDRRVGFGGG